MRIDIVILDHADSARIDNNWVNTKNLVNRFGYDKVHEICEDLKKKGFLDLKYVGFTKYFEIRITNDGRDYLRGRKIPVWQILLAIGILLTAVIALVTRN